MTTLVIENVDLDLFEKQRLNLVSVLEVLRGVDVTTAAEDELLDGLVNMLDAWSDKRYFQKEI